MKVGELEICLPNCLFITTSKYFTLFDLSSLLVLCLQDHSDYTPEMRPPLFFSFFLSFNMLFLHFLLNMKVMLKVLILKSYLFVLWMMLEKVLMYVMFIFVQSLIILYY